MWEDVLWAVASLFGTLLFVVLNALVFVLIYAKVMAGAFNKAAYKPVDPRRDGVRFADVLGADEAVREAREVVDFLTRARDLRAIGATAPRGMLLVGPPGTGKTLIAKAIAAEAGVPFFALSGADFNEVFVGVGASRIRKLYAEARKYPAAIVFIDEIDALGRHRAQGQFGGQEHNNTLNAFLVELDGLGRAGSTVVTIGATNLESALDAALLRPGRFDRKIHVGLPGLPGRRALLAHYLARVEAEAGLDVAALAAATPGMSGAELATLVNEAAIMAVRAGRGRVGAGDFSLALERMGVGQAQGRTVGAAERRVVAWHEAGHAVVGRFLAPRKRLHKVSIVPTGKAALGYTWSVEAEDRHLASREELVAEIAALYGGRLAEELVFGAAAVTSGAGEDLARATAIAEAMVWDLGFAPGLPGAYRDAHRDGRLSERTRAALDEAVGLVLAEAQAEARAVLLRRKDALDRLAAALLAHEALDGGAALALIDGPADGPTSLQVQRDAA